MFLNAPNALLDMVHMSSGNGVGWRGECEALLRLLDALFSEPPPQDYVELARRAGVDPRFVRSLIVRLRGIRVVHELTPEEVERAARLRLAGASLREVAEALGVSLGAVYRALKRMEAASAGSAEAGLRGRRWDGSPQG